MYARLFDMSYVIHTSAQLKPILVGFRKSQGLSQKDIAKKLGISQQAYQTLESAPQSVTLERLMKVLNMLGVKLYLSDTQLNLSEEKYESAKKKNQSALGDNKAPPLPVSHKVETANAPSRKVSKKISKDSW